MPTSARTRPCSFSEQDRYACALPCSFIEQDQHIDDDRPLTIVLPAALFFVTFFFRPARNLSRSVGGGGVKQGSTMEEALPKEKVVSGMVHWETHDTRIALC